MTICLAGICDGDRSIVSVSDMKLSTGEFSTDKSDFKLGKVHRDWWAMFSGNDITPCVPIMRGVVRQLEKTNPILEEVSEAFCASYRAFVVQRVTSEVLAPYDLNMDEFTKNGLKDFGENIFGELNRRIEQVKSSIDIMFLVYGFDSEGSPHLFTISNPGVYACFDKPGFWAIGSGANAAIGMMFFQDFNRLVQVEDALYKACVSKFMAESGSDIGEATLCTVIRNDSHRWFAPDHLINSCRSTWKNQVRKDPVGAEALKLKLSIRAQVEGSLASKRPIAPESEDEKPVGK